ncbi:Orphan sodium- and chloride-dependent neurotransmitter transporter NTT5 [Microtus ochrogaster]|uniref:Orphan sodium- and chloride-dependent neurotransmitter transporter NTT5 n=1 Tax=Microtus ochrogaster TaxID=79684 RepID=A0A8J6G6R2_MICOH|nr:Orphan sodium- and chloride-dependent neurotransmitter transporter NTT5 [Microtus ochrogaster]
MSREESDVFLPRQLWSSKLKFILVMVSYLLMPIQLWRFVSQWLHKGGCSFLIMYTIMLFWIGIPLLFLEMAVGQRVQRASIDLWKTLGPWFGGLGYSTFLVCFITNTYTNLFNSWIFFYMSHIFYFTVPWQHCPFQRNSSSFDPECEQATSYTYFWYRQTLKASDRIEDGGPLAFNLGICLFLAWCLVCVFMMNGIKSFEKVLNVLVLLPYLIIFCFFFRTLPMEGTVYGLKHLLVLKVASIYDPIVWSQAGVQVMLDMGLGFGPIVYLSSYMPDFNNCLGDAFLMVLIKMLTLLFIMPVILSVLGFWATITTHRCCEKNTEKLMMLVAQGILPPEVRPPTLKKNPTSTYNSWLDRLPPPLRSAVLSKVPECNIQEHFLKVSGDAGEPALPHRVQLSLVPERNVEKLMMLVAQGILPPEVRPPTLTKNPTSTYNSWLDRLPPPLRSAVLSKVPECNIQEHFLKESPRFVFLTFTEVISLLPGSFFWTVLFFLLLLSLSLCAMVTFMLGIITPLQDTFPFFRRQPRILTVGASMVMFLCGLFFIQPSGIYYYWLLSEYWIVLPIISIALCENLAVAWAYRAKR